MLCRAATTATSRYVPQHAVSSGAAPSDRSRSPRSDMALISCTARSRTSPRAPPRPHQTSDTRPESPGDERAPFPRRRQRLRLSRRRAGFVRRNINAVPSGAAGGVRAGDAIGVARGVPPQLHRQVRLEIAGCSIRGLQRREREQSPKQHRASARRSPPRAVSSTAI